MFGKIGRIILTLVLSFLFFIVSAILIDWVAGMIFGVKESGSANVNGYILLSLTVLLSIAFGFWFYKYVHLARNGKK